MERRVRGIGQAASKGTTPVITLYKCSEKKSPSACTQTSNLELKGLQQWRTTLASTPISQEQECKPVMVTDSPKVDRKEISRFFCPFCLVIIASDSCSWLNCHLPNVVCFCTILCKAMRQFLKYLDQLIWHQQPRYGHRILTLSLF